MPDQITLGVSEADLPARREDGPADVLSIISAAASDPRVDADKLEKLLALKERIDAREAEMEFTRAFAAASARMPHIAKEGVIDMGAKGKYTYARYEDLDAALRPVESAYGFARSFSTQPDAGGILMTVTLRHAGGHSISSTRLMPPDSGAGRSAMQAIGSASSYARRYLTMDVWNIITVGADDDAVATGYITEKQQDTIQDLFVACECTQDQIQAVLKWTDPDRPPAKLSELPAHQYKRVVNFLTNKLRKLREGA